MWQEMQKQIDEKWDQDLIPQLQEYIRIPNLSPLFDPQWAENGHMNQAMDQVYNWCKKQEISGMELEVIKIPDRTPLLYIDIKGQSDEKTVLLYGHIDKQPEMTGWDNDKGPWEPVISDDKLYGRGGADDGYAVFASLTAIKSLQDQNLPHGRIVVIVEASEESGSTDLPAYLELLQDKIGEVDLVVCLDSGCGDYNTLWSTTSLRGCITGNLNIDIMKEGKHSGQASGIVPSWFNIAAEVVAKIEDPITHQTLVPYLDVNIPEQHDEQAQEVAAMSQGGFEKEFNMVGGASFVDQDVKTLLLNHTWRAAVSVTGIEGVPDLKKAGNVSLPKASLKLSIRLPPVCDYKRAAEEIKSRLEDGSPFGTRVTFTEVEGASGWVAPNLAEWLKEATDKASVAAFDKKAAYMGEGGLIPFMGMLGEMYPQAQFLITGVLGPASNAHGPNEFLHIPFVKKLTLSIAVILKEHYQRRC